MRDAARMAAMSDPDLNFNFRRGWTLPERPDGVTVARDDPPPRWRDVEARLRAKLAEARKEEGA